MLVDSAQAFKRKGGGGIYRRLSKELLYTALNKKKQVIPQTGLSLCFELQRMFTTIKSNIVGNANYKKKKITKEHLSHYLNAYCMLWNCGSELEVNFIMVYVWIYRKNILYIQKKGASKSSTENIELCLNNAFRQSKIFFKGTVSFF